MNADGSDPRNVSNDPGRDDFPAWSTDGTRITYMSDRDGTHALYIVDADGEYPRNLTQTRTAAGCG